ncbi:MAG: HD domain-containing protein [Syntrophomonas sp.]|nr:HD domain-containing protein [Syntrophomonas sp.]
MLNKIAADITFHGGQAFYVGGYVRNIILGISEPEGEDIDIEVYFLSIQELQSILSNYGSVHLVGKSFPVLKISGHPEWDFTLPASSNLTFTEACLRRDFTINSMMMNIISGEIIDILGGKADAANRIIKHTNGEVFSEDPLRVYRAIQFAARLNFHIHPETLKLINQTDLQKIAPERIYEELRKMLLSPQPSIGLRYMQETNVLERMHPLLYNLIGCPQSPQHHPEGDVWEHTLLVVDQAARLRSQAKNPAAFMFAALLHDIGKPETTRMKEDKITSYGHDVWGEKLAVSFMGDLTKNRAFIKEVAVLVREHMHPVLLYKGREHVSDKAIRKLINRINLHELLLISEADFNGRAVKRDFQVIREWFLEKSSRLGLKLNEKIEPLIKGRDLIQMGLSPGPNFLKVLDFAFELQMEGKTRGEIITAINNRH